jgi:5'-nucleotidase
MIIHLNFRQFRIGLILLVLALSACAGQQAATSGIDQNQERAYRILITNDDGIESEGIRQLALAVAEFAEVVVVAPLKNESGASQSSRVLAVRPQITRVDMGGSFSAYAFNSTPADCVAFGIMVFGQDEPFNLVLSGVNEGGNVGSSYLYSGTIGAAFQALVHGIPAIAVSQGTRREALGVATDFTVEVLKSVLAEPTSPGELLSINVPAGAILGVKVLPADLQPYNIKLERLEGDLDVFYKASVHPLDEPYAGYDIESFRKGYITVTPLILDRTAYDSLDVLGQRPFIKAWSVDEG